MFKFTSVSICLLFLSVVTVFFICLTPFSRPHVTSIQLSKGTLQRADLVNQQVKVTFSRPMNQVQTEKAFQIQPKIEGNISWSNSTLFFTPKDPLKSNDAYTVTITTPAQDIYGHHLAQDYTTIFKTRTAEFVYLNEDNQLVLGDLSGTKKVITKNLKIKEFIVNQSGQLIAYIHQSPDSVEYQVFLYHLDTGKTTRILSHLTGQMLDIQFNQDGSQLFFLQLARLSKPLVDQQQTEQDFTSLVFKYDIANEQLAQTDLTQSFPHFEYFNVTGDGQNFIISDQNSEFYLRPMNSSKITTIGKFSEYRDSDQKGDHLVFLDYAASSDYTPHVMVYSGSTIEVPPLDEAASTPSISPDGKIMTYSYVPANNKNAQQAGVRVLSWPERNLLFEHYDPKFSYALSKISPDNQFLAVEEYQKEQLKDYLHIRKTGEPNSPEQATLKFVNLESKEFLPISLMGKELKWVK